MIQSDDFKALVEWCGKFHLRFEVIECCNGDVLAIRSRRNNQRMFSVTRRYGRLNVIHNAISFDDNVCDLKEAVSILQNAIAIGEI